MEDQIEAERTVSDRPSRQSPRSLPAEVQIRLEPGLCYVQAGALFSSADDELIRSFIDRTFLIPAVSMVNVDREHLTLSIRFDQAGRNPRDVLKQIATGLLASPDKNQESVFYSFLARIPGRINRIERQFQAGAELFTVASQGDGFVARSQQCLGKMALVAEPAAIIKSPIKSSKAGEQAVVDAETGPVLVIAQEIVVEYDGDLSPVMIESLDGESQSGGIVALGTRNTVEQLHGRRLEVVENLLQYGRRLVRLSADVGRGGIAWLEARSPVGATRWFALKVEGWSQGKLSVRSHRSSGVSRQQPVLRAENTTFSLNSQLRLLAAAAVLGFSFAIAGFAGPMLLVVGAFGAWSLLAVGRLPVLWPDRIFGGRI
jgi:hypothetical protein